MMLDETGNNDGTDRKPNGDTVMPDLQSPRRFFHHTVDSAIFSLLRAGVSPGQITIEKEGPNSNLNQIVHQEPDPGEPLGPHVRIRLKASGPGVFYRLPTGMRADGERQPRTEQSIGVRELLSIFDDAAEKAACYVRQGGLYFDLRKDNPIGCARWIRLFGLAPEDWPEESWYDLARLLPCLHRIAGLESGIRLALQTLVHVELSSFRWRRRRTPFTTEMRTKLGAQCSRLGVSFVLGEGLEDEAYLELLLGPVSLRDYRKHRTLEGENRLRQVLNLVMPCHLLYMIRWLVGNRELAPSLGIEERNASLGINCHLGTVLVRERNK